MRKFALKNSIGVKPQFGVKKSIIAAAAAPAAINVALASNGSTASASSYESGSGFAASSAINGHRNTQNAYGSDMAWSGVSTANGFPQTLTVNFNQSRTFGEVDIFTIADAVNYSTDPTLSDTFASYGATAWTVDYYNGSIWVNIPECTVSGNNKVWRKFNFASVTGTQIRVVVTASADNGRRLVEVEAWGS